MREILDCAWALMEREGVAAVSVREVARSVGLRQQSLTYYFPTKQALLDALFADGFADLRRVFDTLPAPTDPDAGVVDVAVSYVDYCVTHPARYHLMFQRTIPGFEPTPDSHRIALSVLGELIGRLSAAGVTDEADISLVRSLLSGIAAEQTANDPGGRLFADQTDRGVRALLREIRTRPEPGKRAPSRRPQVTRSR
ncbi:MAG TPA: TetR/AcrR family transcriptional regulator [Sporichthya sp.]|nr:TetR/AcrR family transcriptional regulator [Sporichthya sp.]